MVSDSNIVEDPESPLNEQLYGSIGGHCYKILVQSVDFAARMNSEISIEIMEMIRKIRICLKLQKV